MSISRTYEQHLHSDLSFCSASISRSSQCLKDIAEAKRPITSLFKYLKREKFRSWDTISVWGQDETLAENVECVDAKRLEPVQKDGSVDL